MIYQLLKRMIVTGNYEKDDMQNKLNVFLDISDKSSIILTGLLSIFAIASTYWNPKKSVSEYFKIAKLYFIFLFSMSFLKSFISNILVPSS